MAHDSDRIRYVYYRYPAYVLQCFTCLEAPLTALLPQNRYGLVRNDPSKNPEASGLESFRSYFGQNEYNPNTTGPESSEGIGPEIDRRVWGLKSLF